MLVTAVKLLGLFALAVVITPPIFYLAGIVISVIVLALTVLVRLARQKSLKAFHKVFKKLIWSMADVVYQGDDTKYEIRPPSYTHGTGSVGVGRENNRQMKIVRKLEGEGCYKQPLNNLCLYIPKQPIIKKALNTIPNLFHSALLFYKSFYGHSTTVEQNPFAGRVMLKSSKGSYGKC